MHTFPTLVLAASALTSFINGVPINEKRVTDCNTYITGYLTANTNSGYHQFSSTGTTVTYTGDGQNPLTVQFQVCESLQTPGSVVRDDNPGRIYVPSINKCLNITNQSAEKGPYNIGFATCSTAVSQRFLLDINSSNDILWFGKTDEEGTTPQGGCGVLGYASDSTKTPTTTGSAKAIQLTCGGNPLRVNAPRIN